MDWEMPWYTITESFDTDFGVNEWDGQNVFFRDGERTFAPTTSKIAATRRWAAPGANWTSLPLGRQEEWEDSPEGYPQTPPYKWWNWHDEYAAGAAQDPRWVKVPDNAKVTLNLND